MSCTFAGNSVVRQIGFPGTRGRRVWPLLVARGLGHLRALPRGADGRSEAGARRVPMRGAGATVGGVSARRPPARRQRRRALIP